MDEITLLTGEDSIDERVSGPVGLLFECAPDSRVMQAGGQVAPLAELIGTFDAVKQEAQRLARRLLADEPRVAGFGLLGIFEEVVIREMQKILHAIHLFRTLESRGMACCRVKSVTACVAALRQVCFLQPGRLQVETDTATRTNQTGWWTSIQRALTRLRQQGLCAASMEAEWRQVMTRIDPFHRQSWAWFPRRQKPLCKGGAWFYSTAYTFSKIGLLYEPFVPGGFNYLVENPLTCGRALDETGREYHDLYRFAADIDVPTEGMIATARQCIRQHLMETTLDGDDDLARQLFVESAFFAQFLQRHLPQVLFQVRLFERFLDEVEPQAVMVGNPVFEGPLLHLARQREVPTVLFQHGILGDFCQFIDPPVDHYVVRGAFWKDFLSDAAAAKARVLNPPVTSSAGPQEAVRVGHILFLTAPYSTQEFFNPADRDDILLALLRVSGTTRRQLVIRVHPMESVGLYRQVVTALRKRYALDVSGVRYSYGTGLEEVVRESAVAVTFNSTVFLDCLRCHVPIVSFGWHDFSYRKQIEDCGVFHFAQSLDDLQKLIERALNGELPPFNGSTQPFLETTQEQMLRTFFSLLLQGACVESAAP